MAGRQPIRPQRAPGRRRPGARWPVDNDRGQLLAGLFESGPGALAAATGTKFYLHEADSAIAGLPTATQSVNNADGQTQFTPVNTANGTPGVAQVSRTGTLNSSALPATNPGVLASFATAPLAAQTIPAGNWTFALAGADSAPNRVHINLVAYVWRPSTSTLVGMLFDPVASAGWVPGSTTEAAGSITNVGASVVAADGDVIIFEVWAYASTVAGSTATFYFDGTTEGSTTSNAANVVAPATIAYQAASSKLYLHSQARGAGPALSKIFTPDFTSPNANVNRALDSTRGSAQTSEQVTATAAGYGLHGRWVSKALAAQTIPAVSWTLETAWSCGVAANVGDVFLNVYVYRPSTDSIVGAAIVNLAQAPAGSPAGTPEAVVSATVAGGSVTVLDGDRLVVEVARRYSAATTGTLYFDGITENSAASEAAFLSAPLTLSYLPVLTAAPTGIGDTSTIGTPKASLTAQPAGIAVSGSPGTPAAKLQANPAGVANSSTIGTPSANTKASPTGIAVSGSPGNPSAALKAQPAGIANTSTIGTPLAKLTAQPAGIASSSSVGSPAATLKAQPNGIAVSGGPGAPAAALKAAPNGIADSSGVGTPAAKLTAQPAGVANSSTIGTPSASLKAAPAGIADSSHAGAPAATLKAQPTGIADTSSIGTPTVTTGAPGITTVYPAGIGDSSSIGTPTVTTGTPDVPGVYTSGGGGLGSWRTPRRRGLFDDDDVIEIEVLAPDDEIRIGSPTVRLVEPYDYDNDLRMLLALDLV